MADRSDKMARLDPGAVEDAEQLLAAMELEGVEASRDKIIRVLLWGVTAPQAVGMLRAYIEHTARRKAAARGTQESSTSAGAPVEGDRES